ncbi:putative CRISPR-associated protein, VVA1548 family [Pseudomonas pohangensis]|uniref:Putative CRISPR-associated protein, VVA1548 family n=2 Tax=Pseudomonas pohangensis TaxID=364197 RepID=A0A1H2G1Q4_9PSED|nr:putative CRISPR-associated protein, VVA1548 family [Pseudomonas pohangensis]
MRATKYLQASIPSLHINWRHYAELLVGLKPAWEVILQVELTASGMSYRNDKLVYAAAATWPCFDGGLQSTSAESLPSTGRAKMTTWFVSRHQGACNWLAEQGHMVDRLVAHLELAQLQAGDTVYGSLPVHMVAELGLRGVRYMHLILELPASARGQELTAEDMRRYGARLVCFEVQEVLQ